MKGRHVNGLRWLLALGGISLFLASGASGEERGSSERPIRIGVSGVLFRDVSDAVVAAMSQPFNKVMVNSTGMSGELTKVSDTFDLARKIMDDRVQLGIFTGFEFAWVQQKHADLKPLMTLVTDEGQPQVFVITAADSKVREFADLKGQTLSQPRSSRPYALLFLDRKTAACGQDPKRFFSGIKVISESSEALDDVAEGASQAAMVDNVTWDWYQKNKPKRTAKLRVAIASEKFPATVVAYYPGNLTEATVKQFRRGMLNAHEDPIGKQLMSLWKMTGFQEVPDDYTKSVHDILKAYPSPAVAEARKE